MRVSAPADNRFRGDLVAAAKSIGTRIKGDDLKVVEGIGPVIEKMLHKDGIKTWNDLANAPVSQLQAVLDRGGRRMQIHDPGTWPQQARLLANEKWDAFKKLTDQLKGGRRV